MELPGCFSSPGAPSHTAAAVAPFFVHQELRTAMGNAARTRVQRDFSEADMIDGFERAASAGADRKRWSRDDTHLRSDGHGGTRR